jgi:Rrf2 family protein
MLGTVDLTLSKAGDYAVRAAVSLASAWEENGYTTTAQIAEDMDLPRSYTPQVLGMLARAGLVTARTGRHGGHRLTRPPSQISMLEVVEAAEGTLGTARCPLSGGPCRWDEACAVHPTWHAVTDAVRQALARTTLDDVAREDRALEIGRRRRALT